VVRKEGKNGRFGHLSLAETTCQAKTVYWAGGVYNKSTSEQIGTVRLWNARELQHWNVLC
jgi:hypothetical protein